MDKFRIVCLEPGISVDYTHDKDYSAEIILNIIEVETHESPFDRSKDPALKSQTDKYSFVLHDITATTYEQVFRKIINKTITFYPDRSLPGTIEMKVIRAKHFYLKSNLHKDALYLDLIQKYYKGS